MLQPFFINKFSLFSKLINLIMEKKNIYHHQKGNMTINETENGITENKALKNKKLNAFRQKL